MVENKIKKLKEIIENHQCAKIEKVLVDVQTANILVQLYDRLNEDNRDKLFSYPMKVMGSIAWQLVAGGK